MNKEKQEKVNGILLIIAIIISGICMFLILLNGCKDCPCPSSDYDASPTYTVASNFGKDYKYYGECHAGAYRVIYVDVFLEDNCYAIRHEGSDRYVLDIMNRSFELEQYGSDFRKYFLEKRNIVCINGVEDEGDVYCLRDRSKCLVIEDEGKICDIITLSGEQRTNENNINKKGG